MSKQLENIRHDYIRYANCWEDADLLLEGFKASKGGRILSIGSGGDNSFALLTTNPELVVAVDINRVQLNLIELKKVAIAQLDYPQFLELMGFKESEQRRELFRSISDHLPLEVVSYWKNHIEQIEAGIIYQGKFEQYFNVFRNKLLPLIHTQKRIIELFHPKTGIEQKAFYENQWNNWRWRMLFNIFFSKFVIGRFGRDPAFLKEVSIPVSKYIFDKSAVHLSSQLCQENYFLHFILTGKFGKNLPYYAREENYNIIKMNIDRLEVFEGLAEDVFNRYKEFNYYNLSDIFEYMNSQIFKSVVENLVANSNPGDFFAYWNLMVPRRMSEVSPENFSYLHERSEKLTSKDKGFFYNCFILEQRI